MPNFELSISPNYVANWSLVHAVREIFQNALDRQTEDPENPFLFEYDPDLQLLKIGNKKSTLHPSTLVMGNSTKGKDERLIGQFGEGYKLALVVLLRLGKSVTIYNNPEVWTPTIKMSDSFKTPILNINSVKYRFKTLPEQDLIFQISGVTSDEFEQIREANLYFHEATETLDSEYGKILLDPRYRGRIYVSGLYIATIERVNYGYDFKPAHINIGRDRDLVSEWEVLYKTAAMWAKQEGRAALVEQMIRDKAPDVEDIRHHVWQMPKETIRYIGGGWYGTHGPNAIPCSNEKQAQQARDLHGPAARVVIVSPQLMAILQQTDEYKNFTAKTIVSASPHELMRKTLRHLNNFKPGMRNDIKALMEMSRHWGWVKI